MAERGHRVYATQTVRISKTIEAPLRYVYDWCTDYRSDDASLHPRRPGLRFRVVRLSPRRLVRIRLAPRPTSPDPLVAVDLVRLQPPNAWHTDQIDEEDRESVDYRLTSLGPSRTRIELLITERWVVPDHQSAAGVRERANAAWDRYKAFIEDRYRGGRPAKG